MGTSTISLSWEWILGIFITLILIFLGWVLKQVSDLKKDIKPRIRFLENENSNKNAKIELLEKITLNPFEKGEKTK
ncbi:hypothetical protein BMS3Abin17_01073 [archaeon BMS3Abin17]|nr:hypothetical protein BMS3Abin17_01073 [archaeon BMS3Abin17]HDZ61273.1 hypothetical protein [Candidatus Pacearchaeota archaeon]